MAEEHNKWTREEGFFRRHGPDIIMISIALLCAATFILMALTQLNMDDLVQNYFREQAAAHPEAPRQPDMVLKPGETGITLYPEKPAPVPKSPQNRTSQPGR